MTTQTMTQERKDLLIKQIGILLKLGVSLDAAIGIYGRTKDAVALIRKMYQEK